MFCNEGIWARVLLGRELAPPGNTTEEQTAAFDPVDQARAARLPSIRPTDMPANGAGLKGTPK